MDIDHNDGSHTDGEPIGEQPIEDEPIDGAPGSCTTCGTISMPRIKFTIN